MRAVVYLERIQKLDELIDAKILEKEDLLERATSLAPNMDGMPHAPGVSITFNYNAIYWDSFTFIN